MVLVVVVLHNRCVDAQIHDEAYYEERYKERVEWIRHKLKTYYYSNTPYSKWIRKPKKMAKHYGINPIPPDFKERCGVSAFEKYTNHGQNMDEHEWSVDSKFFCATMLFTWVPKEGYPPLCYMCGPFDHKCWFHLGAMVDESCVGHGLFGGFGPTDPDLDGWINNLGTSAENPGMPPPLHPDHAPYTGQIQI